MIHEDNMDLLIGYYAMIAAAGSYDRYARSVIGEIVRLYAAAGEPIPQILAPFMAPQQEVPEIDA